MQDVLYYQDVFITSNQRTVYFLSKFSNWTDLNLLFKYTANISIYCQFRACTIGHQTPIYCPTSHFYS